MIKDLISSALGSEGAGILEGLGLASDKQEQALDLAKDNVMAGITDTMKSGGIGDITKAFSGGTSSSLVQSIISNYGSSLISKLGLSDSLAKTISTTLIPMIFSFINKKDDAPTDSDEGVMSLLGDLAGGGSITDKIGGIFNKLKF